MRRWLRHDAKPVPKQAAATTARVTNLPRNNVATGRGFVFGFALAASVLAVVGVALSRRDGGGLAEIASLPPETKVARGGVEAPVKQTAAPPAVFKEVQLTGDDGAEIHPVLLPVYQPRDVSEDASSFRYEEALPKSVLDRLAKEGLRVQTERRWTYIRTEPGRGVLVPEYTPKLQPIAYSGRN
jgi:hypothetical protein